MKLIGLLAALLCCASCGLPLGARACGESLCYAVSDAGTCFAHSAICCGTSQPLCGFADVGGEELKLALTPGVDAGACLPGLQAKCR